jgi:hypothetical protein
VRTPQQHAHEISFEQWKGIANTWFMTVGKLALAGMALHFSGLATPLLANFGYAPASQTPTNEHVLRPAVQTASLAAASVMPEPAVSAIPEPVAEAAPVPATAARRWSAKREPRPTLAATPATPATSATTAPAARRHSAKPAHKAKPKSPARSKPAREAEAPAVAAAAPSAAALPAAEPTIAPQPLVAAAANSGDAAGEGTLRINSRPWSEIYVDGTHVGHTPKLDLRVSAGNHRVRLVNQELGLSKTIELNAPAGETVSHVELFIE